MQSEGSRALVGLLVGVVGCTPFNSKLDAGQACATFEPQDDGFVAKVEVVHRCPPLEMEHVINECELQLDGRTLTISSVFVYQPLGRHKSICGEPLDTTCELESPLAPGKYSVRYGNGETEIELVGDIEETCL